MLLLYPVLILLIFIYLFIYLFIYYYFSFFFWFFFFFYFSSIVNKLGEAESWRLVFINLQSMLLQQSMRNLRIWPRIGSSVTVSYHPRALIIYRLMILTTYLILVHFFINSYSNYIFYYPLMLGNCRNEYFSFINLYFSYSHFSVLKLMILTNKSQLSLALDHIPFGIAKSVVRRAKDESSVHTVAFKDQKILEKNHPMDSAEL